MSKYHVIMVLFKRNDMFAFILITPLLLGIKEFGFVFAIAYVKAP